MERRLEELLRRLRETDGSHVRASLPEPRVLVLEVSDHEASFWTELGDGRVGELRSGLPDEAHVRIQADSDDIVALADGELAFVPAYLSGRIRVEGGALEMLQLRRLL
ncbi:MAG TPA: SCP2 sterol-binding domain-containing protein [Actinomycetota bacterium]